MYPSDGSPVLFFNSSCPWVNSCVGQNNHRYFILMLFWGCIYSFAVAITSTGSVSDFILEVFGWTFSSVLFCFIVFQVYLLMHDMTTIELLEGYRVKDGNSNSTVKVRVLVQRSPWENVWRMFPGFLSLLPVDLQTEITGTFGNSDCIV